MANAPAGKAKPTIVVKRIKKVTGGGHGGAWKIAYADFVTAMMAFFLLMWLLGSTTAGDLKGIADYFQNPMKVSMAGGSGAGDATSVIQGGGTDLTKSPGQVRNTFEERAERRRNIEQAKHELEQAETVRLQNLKGAVENALANHPRLAEFKDQIKLDLTPEGLRIQIVDDQQRAMFDTGKAVMKPYMQEILRAIAPVLNEVDHKITLLGHTDATPFAGGDAGYSNWELSADRANASRRALVSGGIAENKIVRVAGLASSVPLIADDPSHPANRRISIIVMNKKTEDRFFNRPEADAQAEDTSAADAAAGPKPSKPPESMSPLEKLNEGARMAEQMKQQAPEKSH